jgi:hypothetical protein
LIGSDYASLVVRRDHAGLKVSLLECRGADRGGRESEVGSEKITARDIYLRVSVSPGANCVFGYGSNGTEFRSLGGSFVAKPGRWVGAKVGLFSESATGKGSADFEFFRVTMP